MHIVLYKINGLEKNILRKMLHYSNDFILPDNTIRIVDVSCLANQYVLHKCDDALKYCTIKCTDYEKNDWQPSIFFLIFF